MAAWRQFISEVCDSPETERFVQSLAGFAFGEQAGDDGRKDG
jgi:hypothetical protein